MGLQAQIVAVGSFSQKVVPYLNYPPEYYKHTHDGVGLAEIVFWIETGSTDSRELAECFGVDPWDFNQHELNAETADLERLTKLVGDKEVASFIGLRAAGFRFFFVPNG